MSGTYQTTNPRASVHPLRSIPLLRPVHTIFGYSDAQKAEWNLSIARTAVASLEARFASNCAALGAANRMTGRMKATRRMWQGKALRQINITRKQLREARAELLAAMAAPALASNQLPA